MSALDEFAENLIAPRISMVSGVSQVQVQGAAKYAVRVQIDPEKLHAQEIGINEVDQAITNWNVNQPTGQLYGPNTTYPIKASGQLMNADAYRPIIVTYRNGSPVRLGDRRASSTASRTCSTATGFIRRMRTETDVEKRSRFRMRQPGSNTIEVTDAVRNLLPRSKRSCRQRALVAAAGSVAHDSSRFRDIRLTMIVTLILVVGVIYLFLHNSRRR
jgi:HAE1 family hydrophobic/amphiphilic exporter-1